MVPGGIAFWWLSEPEPLAEAAVPAHEPDLANGKLMYTIGGCISCHKPGPDQADAKPDIPSGGTPFKTPIGTFYPPNLTPDPETGIGKWTKLDFLNATMHGLSPGRQHLIPAFPYTSYAEMKPEDLLDIQAYLATLPPVKTPSKLPDIFLPNLTRRGFGLWKDIGFNPVPWEPDKTKSESWNRGAYLVNGPGHCGECHTARNVFMVSRKDRFLAGGAHPMGDGRVPSLRSLIPRQRYKDVSDLASALQYGEIMGYDRLSSGGMGDVQADIAQLPESDIKAIAEYLASLE